MTDSPQSHVEDRQEGDPIKKPVFEKPVIRKYGPMDKIRAYSPGDM